MMRPPVATTAKVPTTIGSCSGSDSKVSRPKMSLRRSGDIRDLFTNLTSDVVRGRRTRTSAARKSAASGRRRAAAGVFVVGQRQGVVQALMAEAALGVDRHHLALAHLAGLDAHVEDQAVEIVIDGAPAPHRLVLAGLLELKILGAAERAAGGLGF